MNQKPKALLITFIGFIIGSLLSILIYSITPVSKQKNKSVNRIISLAPNVTEIIFKLGFGEKLIGVSDFCILPQSIIKTKLGNNFEVNYERLIALKPDIIFTQGANENLKKFCKNKGIKYINLSMDSINTIISGIKLIGKIINAETNADDLLKKINEGLQKIKNKTKNIKPIKTLLIVNRRTDTLSGVFTIGKDSFLSQLLEISGGINIFTDLKINYSSVSIESIIKRNPEIIIEISISGAFSESVKNIMLKQWDAYPSIHAVKGKKIYFISDDFVLIPSSKIIQTTELFYNIMSGGK